MASIAMFGNTNQPDNGARKALIPLENKRNFLEVFGDIVERLTPCSSPIDDGSDEGVGHDVNRGHRFQDKCR